MYMDLSIPLLRHCRTVYIHKIYINCIFFRKKKSSEYFEWICLALLFTAIKSIGHHNGTIDGPQKKHHKSIKMI